MADSATVGILRALLSLDTAEFETGMKTSAEAMKTWSSELQNFGDKHRQSFAAIGQATTLALGAVTALGAGIIALGTRGSEVADVADGFRQMTSEMGDADEVLKALRDSVDGTITNFDLMKSVNAAFSQGLRLTTEELALTGEAARILADRVGIETKDAFDQLTASMANGRDRGLALIGMNIDAAASMDSFARSIGKATTDLTENEQIIGKRNAILQQMRREVEASGGVEADFADRLAQSKVAVQNFTDALGVAIATSPAVNVALGTMTEAFAGAFGDNQVVAVQTLTGYVNQFAIRLVDVASIALSVAGAIVTAFQGVRAILFFTLEALTRLGQGWLDLQITVLQAANAMMIGSPFDAQIASLKALRTYMDGARQSFGATGEAAVDAAGAWGTAADAAQKKLAAMRAEMVRLVAAGVSTDEIAKRLRVTGEAAGVSAGQIKKLADEEAKRAAALRQYYNWIGEREIEAVGDAQKSAEARATAEREMWNQIGAARMDAEAAQLESIEAQAAAWRAYYNELGIRRMEDDAAAMKAAGALGRALKDSLQTTLQSIPQTLASAMTGGGGLRGAIQSIGSQLGSGLGKTVANLMGFAGPWGQAIGGAIGSLAPLLITPLGKLFGVVSEAIKKSRKDVDDFQDSLAKTLTATQRQEAGNEKWRMTVIAVRDAYLATGRTVAEAEAIVKQLWDTDHPERAKAALEQINAVLAEQQELLKQQQEQLEKNKDAAGDLFDELMDAASEAGDAIPDSMRPVLEQFLALGLLTDEQAAKLRGLGNSAEVDWKKMEEAAKRYGIEEGALGGKFNSSRLHAGAQTIIDDFDLLTRGGGDVGGVLFGMREEISQLVRDSLKFGTTIPANMKPWIDELLRSGNLLDENGDAMTDLGGLRWGDKVQTQAEKTAAAFDAILAKIQELIDRITNGLVPALANLPAPRLPGDGPPAVPGDIVPPDYGGGLGGPLPGRASALSSVGGWASRMAASAALAAPLLSAASLSAPMLPSPSSMLSVPSVMRDVGSSSSSMMVLAPIVMQPGMDADRVVDQVFRQLPSGFAGNRHGVRVAIKEILKP